MGRGMTITTTVKINTDILYFVHIPFLNNYTENRTKSLKYNKYFRNCFNTYVILYPFYYILL